MSGLDDYLAANTGQGSWQNPPNNITWPTGAVSGDYRMVAGADTPPELQAYGILVALLFYVTDKDPPNNELGYFFIGLSNTLDAGADGEVCLFGNVKYPIPDNPLSPTMSDVKTNFQMNLFGTDVVGEGYTVFKDSRIEIYQSVLSVWFRSPLVIFGSSVLPTDVQFNSPVFFMPGAEVQFHDSTYLIGNGVTAYTIEATDPINNPSTVSTLYTATANVFGTTFVAPPSGTVFVTIEGWIGSSSSTVGQRAYMAGNVRVGAVVNAGALVYTATDERAAMYDSHSTAAGFKYQYGCVRHRVNGLTPGTTYNLTHVIRTDTAAVSAFTYKRILLVEPSLIF